MPEVAVADHGNSPSRQGLCPAQTRPNRVTGDALVSCGDLVESVSLVITLTLPGGGDLERFVKIFVAVLLATENSVDAVADSIAGLPPGGRSRGNKSFM